LFAATRCLSTATTIDRRVDRTARCGGEIVGSRRQSRATGGYGAVFGGLPLNAVSGLAEGCCASGERTRRRAERDGLDAHIADAPTLCDTPIAGSSGTSDARMIGVL
jgi:hypothetical protein